MLETVTKFCLLQVVQVTQASIDAVSDSESSIFLQWVWLASNSIVVTPTNKQSQGFQSSQVGRPGIIRHTALHLECTQIQAQVNLIMPTIRHHLYVEKG